MIKKLLNNKIISSLFWVAFEKFGYSGIYFIGTLILARLLSPTEFGIIGILAIFISFSQMIVESGLGGALVKKKIVSEEDYDTIFTFNITIASILYILLFICAPYIADFYNNNDLTNITRIVGLNLFLSSLTLTQRVHLIRDLQFRKQSIISILALTISILASVSIAYNGRGVWALVFQQIIYNFFYLIFIFYSVKYIPKIGFNKDSFKELYGFGSKIFGASLLSILYTEGISSIIAKLYSVSLTGLYYQAKKLVDFPINIYRSLGDNVVFPVLSRVKTEDDFAKKSSILMQFILIVSLPIFIILYFYSTPIVEFVLGDQWIKSAEILNILCLGSIGLTIDTVSKNILKATGNGTAILKSELWKKLIGVVLIIISIQYNFYMLLYSLVIGNLLGCIVNVVYVNNLTSYKFKSQLKDVLPILIIAIILGIASNLISQYFDLNTILGIFIFIILYLLASTYYLKKINIKVILNED